MESHNVLTDDMHVGRPVLVISLSLLVYIVAKSGDIVGKSVYPHVDNVLLVKGHGHAPLKGAAGNTKILQTGL